MQVCCHRHCNPAHSASTLTWDIALTMRTIIKFVMNCVILQQRVEQKVLHEIHVQCVRSAVILPHLAASRTQHNAGMVWAVCGHRHARVQPERQAPGPRELLRRRHDRRRCRAGGGAGPQAVPVRVSSTLLPCSEQMLSSHIHTHVSAEQGNICRPVPQTIAGLLFCREALGMQCCPRASVQVNARLSSVNPDALCNA